MGLFDLFRRRKKEPESPVEEPVAADAAPVTAGPAAQPTAGQKVKRALNRTRAFFASAFATDPTGLVDPEFYDEMTDGLVLADVGFELAQSLTERISAEMKERGLVHKRDAVGVARDVLSAVLTNVKPAPALEPGTLSVVLLVGVNGSGKTTLAAKLAHQLKRDGLTVQLVAADTFRAAAVDQLKVWAQRAGVDIVAGQEGADPAAVVFDGAQAANARDAEVMIVDTAGRLQTKQNLMAELEKIARTVDKACPGAAVARILVLDATVGQNALSQAELFNQCCELTGIALTKMDGTAKGGAVFAAVDKLKLPILYVGVGETLDDLLDFNARDFVDGLLPEA